MAQRPDHLLGTCSIIRMPSRPTRKTPGKSLPHLSNLDLASLLRSLQVSQGNKSRKCQGLNQCTSFPQNLNHVPLWEALQADKKEDLHPQRTKASSRSNSTRVKRLTWWCRDRKLRESQLCLDHETWPRKKPRLTEISHLQLTVSRGQVDATREDEMSQSLSINSLHFTSWATWMA